jgi:hypothetical protein
MEKFTGQLVLVTRKEFIAIATSEEELRYALSDFLDDLSREGKDVEEWLENNKNDLEVYATINKSWTPDFKVQPGELDLDELSESEPYTHEIEVTSGGYLHGETFDSEDELVERVKDVYEDGYMTVEDIEQMEVRRVLHEDTSFYSVDEGEREVVFDATAADDEQEIRHHTSIEYVRYDDLEAHMDRMLKEQVAKHLELSADTSEDDTDVPVTESAPEYTPDMMDRAEIDKELAVIEERLELLNRRKYVLKQELEQRGDDSDLTL